MQQVLYWSNLNPGSVTFKLYPVQNLYSLLEPFGVFRLLIILVIGGFIVGSFISLTTKKVSGHGVPEILEAILTKGGYINPKIALYKTIVSGVTIGSGFSLGREGPIAQIGSATESYVGQFTNKTGG
ncbi:chloride channel protein [Methanohalobium sp.]|uniref:chloride channel protein n=1 Tax=Methanohalobium sp. TaxID=2837493 RepID=UPI0025FBCA0C|nr:chloride channel protein [Methanohalobium sp.]